MNKKPEERKSTWIGRSLENYKIMHGAAARQKGVMDKLFSAKTLTEARKVVFGYKKKNTR